MVSISSCAEKKSNCGCQNMYFALLDDNSYYPIFLGATSWLSCGLCDINLSKKNVATPGDLCNTYAETWQMDAKKVCKQTWDPTQNCTIKVALNQSDIYIACKVVFASI